MRAVVIGAGGIGSYLGAVLARAGRDVDLVVRGAHRDAIERDGLRVRRETDPFVVHPRCVGSALESAEADPRPVDVVLLAVKAYSLDEVAPQVRHLALAGAAVVPVLNGVDVTERLRAAGVPAGAVLDGVAYLTAFRTAPGVTEPRAAHRKVVVGSADGLAARGLPRAVALFEGAEIQAVIEEDIGPELWRKMAVVCSLAVLCGITGSGIGRVRAHALGRELQERAVAEVIAVGRAAGVALPEDAEEHVHDILDAFPDDFYPSVLHDLKSGRPTEMEHLGGVIARLGRVSAVDTPLHDAATCAVRLIETGESAWGRPA